MEAKENKKVGAPLKGDKAKTIRVELRLTKEQAELLDMAVGKRKGGTRTVVLTQGLFYYLKNQWWFRAEEHFHEYRKICNLGPKI